MRNREIILLICGALALGGCGKREVAVETKAGPPPAASVHVVELKEESFLGTLAITGSLVSRSVVDLKAETIGRIERFDKEEGDAVKAGEVVVWVDDEKPRLAVREAESVVAVAQATVDRVLVMEAHNQSENERAERLVASGGITEKDLKGAQVAMQDSRAQEGLARAQLAQARAALATARKRVADCQIKAPVNGVIFKKHVNKGAYVEAPTAVFSLVDNRRLELESPVSASDLGQVRTGQAARFEVSSYRGEKFTGRVVEISPAVDVVSRSANVRIQVDNSSGRLKAGMFGQGEIDTGARKQAILIPLGAVYRDDQSAKDSFVYVVEDGKAKRRSVRIGVEQPQGLEIIEGLKAGELLVTERSIELADGAPVKRN